MKYLVLLLLTACTLPVELPDGGTSAVLVQRADPSTSGTRLQVTRPTLRGADGSVVQLPAVIWDSLLDIECSFVAQPDHTYRCLPGFAASESEFYLDASCSQLVARAQQCDPERKYAAAYSECGWSLITKAEFLGETPPSYLYWKDADGVCNREDNDFIKYGSRFYAVGEPVDISIFALGMKD